MKVKFSPRARRRVKLLKSQPTLGLVYQALDGEVVRRMLLPRTQQHVYYVVDEEQGVVLVYTVWGARRGRGPKL